MNIIISIAILLIKKQKLKQVTLNIFFLMIDRQIIVITIMRVVHIEIMIIIQKRHQLFIQNHKLKQIIKKYLFQRI